MRYNLFFLLLISGCNYTDGQCWLVSDNYSTGNTGGTIIVNQGGFGNEPKPEPQGSPAQPPCNTRVAECVVTWENGSEYCDKNGDCTRLFQVNAATLEDARKICRQNYGIDPKVEGSKAIDCGPCNWEGAESEATYIVSYIIECVDLSTEPPGYGECREDNRSIKALSCNNAQNKIFNECSYTDYTNFECEYEYWVCDKDK